MLIERLTHTRTAYANAALTDFNIPRSYTWDATLEALSDRMFDRLSGMEHLDYVVHRAHVLCRRDRLNNVYRQF